MSKRDEIISAMRDLCDAEIQCEKSKERLQFAMTRLQNLMDAFAGPIQLKGRERKGLLLNQDVT